MSSCPPSVPLAASRPPVRGAVSARVGTSRNSQNAVPPPGPMGRFMRTTLPATVAEAPAWAFAPAPCPLEKLCCGRAIGASPCLRCPLPWVRCSRPGGLGTLKGRPETRLKTAESAHLSPHSTHVAKRAQAHVNYYVTPQLERCGTVPPPQRAGHEVSTLKCEPV